jgi:hypothetical protein
MQDYAPGGLPSFNVPDLGLPNFGLGISGGLLSILFGITVLFTAIFTIMLFNHWRKHSPSPLRAFKYAVIYTIGTGVILFTLMMLLPLYSGNA